MEAEMSRKPIVAVIGAGQATPQEMESAYHIGRRIAEKGAYVLTGGLWGVMESASHGAKDAGGEVIGVLPGSLANTANPYVDIPIVTNMGHARNTILCHTADLLVAVGGKLGTISEIAVALKIGKTVVSFDSPEVPGTTRLGSLDEVLSFLDAAL
jgi:uncharacterized protein (TIGR00725 family)